MCAQLTSPVRVFATPWTAAHQASLSMKFSRQESWSVLPFLLQGLFLTQGQNLYFLHLLHWQADSLPLNHLGSPVGTFTYICMCGYMHKYLCIRMCVCTHILDGSKNYREN